MLSFIASFETINVVMSDPTIFLWITSFDADTAVHPNGIKALLANGLSTFPIKGKPGFSNSLKSLPKNPLIVLFYSI